MNWVLTLKALMKKNQKLKNFLKNDPLAKRTWEYALALEGLNRNAGTHAAGVVSYPTEPLWNKSSFI